MRLVVLLAVEAHVGEVLAASEAVAVVRTAAERLAEHLALPDGQREADLAAVLDVQQLDVEHVLLFEVARGQHDALGISRLAAT